MTTYPLPTLGPTVDATGISIPAFNDILLSLQASYQTIYGADIDLDSDTQDGQWLAIQAKAINDCNLACVATYNQFSPATAQGMGLSSVIKINGIKRLVPSNSSAPVNIVGQAGTEIINGVIGDNQSLGTQWTLPPSVTIPSAGTIEVTATCTTPGAIAAAANTLTKMLTPTGGWQSVTNPSAATLGAPTESDATLRKRQASSTQLPALTVMGGIFGDIENLTGVTAVSLHQNDTSSADGIGAPANSICFSVLGGDLQSIVNIIGARKSIGCNTWGGGTGAASGTYTDPTTGQTYTINFNIPTQEVIGGTIHIAAGAGYSTAIGDEIIAAVVAMINDLGIGKSVQYTRLYAPALLVGPYASPGSPDDADTYELTSILIAANGGSQSAADVTIAFNQVAVTDATHWTVSTS